MIGTGKQIRAARALVGWSQGDLARAAGLHVNTVKGWEGRDVIGGGHGVEAMRDALEGQGVRFTGGGAVIEDAAA